METIFDSLMTGILQSFEPLNLAMLILGCTVGLVVGALPGLGSVNGVAILLPVTFLVPPTTAIIFLAAIYYGAMYGGAVSSITLGIPGASTAVATVFDGRPLAQQGKADLALVTAAVASFIGGTISVILFTLFAPPLAEFALKFGPPEEFTLMVLAFATFIGLGGDSSGHVYMSLPQLLPTFPNRCGHDTDPRRFGTVALVGQTQSPQSPRNPASSTRNLTYVSNLEIRVCQQVLGSL